MAPTTKGLFLPAGRQSLLFRPLCPNFFLLVIISFRLTEHTNVRYWPMLISGWCGILCKSLEAQHKKHHDYHLKPFNQHWIFLRGHDHACLPWEDQFLFSLSLPDILMSPSFHSRSRTNATAGRDRLSRCDITPRMLGWNWYQMLPERHLVICLPDVQSTSCASVGMIVTLPT